MENRVDSLEKKLNLLRNKTNLDTPPDTSPEESFLEGTPEDDSFSSCSTCHTNDSSSSSSSSSSSRCSTPTLNDEYATELINATEQKCANLKENSIAKLEDNAIAGEYVDTSDATPAISSNNQLDSAVSIELQEEIEVDENKENA